MVGEGLIVFVVFDGMFFAFSGTIFCMLDEFSEGVFKCEDCF